MLALKIKRYFLIFGVLLVTTLFAEVVTIKGVKGGLNIANFSENFTATTVDGGEKLPIYRYSGGFFFDVQVYEVFSFQPELLLSVRGASFEYDAIEEIEDDEGFITRYITQQQTYNLMYVEVPMLAKLNFNMSPNTKFAIFVGPSIAFNVDANLKSTYEVKDTRHGLVIDETKSTDSEPLIDIETIDFAIVSGFGFDIAMIRVDARYHFGLTPFIHSDFGEFDDVKHTGVSVMLGVRF